MTSTHDIPVQCTRCKHKHNESERVGKPDTKHRYMTHMVCPRCGCKSYYNLIPSVAYCWAGGLIEIGTTVPDGAIEIARGPKCDLELEIETVARHGMRTSAGKLLVPGIPEAADQAAAGDALAAFLTWAGKSRTAKKRGVVFASAPAPNPVTAGLDRTTSGAIGQP